MDKTSSSDPTGLKIVVLIFKFLGPLTISCTNFKVSLATTTLLILSS